ncbi:MAG: AAA family ATPase [Tunicatimonas sp.]
MIDKTLTFEVGGRNKSYQHIKGTEQAYVAADNIEIGFKNKVPLWLFGFLY